MQQFGSMMVARCCLMYSLGSTLALIRNLRAKLLVRVSFRSTDAGVKGPEPSSGFPGSIVMVLALQSHGDQDACCIVRVDLCIQNKDVE